MYAVLNNMSVNATSSSVLSANDDSLFMDTFIASAHIICASFGIPVNVTIIFFIIVRRRLRRQPRIIIWIGIGFSSIFFLLYNILEPIGYYYSPHEVTGLCFVQFFLAGFPGAAFLMYNFLSLVDRYLSIFHSVWYRRCVTARLVFGIQLVAFVILFFMMKFHYIFGLIQVKCNVVHPLDRAIYIGFIVLFLVLCLSGQLTVYIMIKRHLVLTNKDDGSHGGSDTTTYVTGTASPARNNQQNGSFKTFNPSTDRPNNEEIIAPQEAVRALGQHVSESASIIRQNLHFVRIRHEMVSRLELEATRNVILDVGIFLLFSSPWIITSVLAQICNGNVIHQAMSEGETTKALLEQCSRYYWALSYTRLVLMIGHSVYQFSCYVMRSKEFCTAPGRA